MTDVKFNNDWLKKLTLPQFKTWCADNKANEKYLMTDADIDATWNDANPKPEVPAKPAKTETVKP